MKFVLERSYNIYLGTVLINGFQKLLKFTIKYIKKYLENTF